jgi:hypothetical protein
MDEVCCAPGMCCARGNGPGNRRTLHGVRSALGFAMLLLVVPVWTQNAPPRQSQQGSPFTTAGNQSPAEFDDSTRLQQREHMRALNAERQKAMVLDANKLLRLVNELNAEIASNKEDSLTPAQLRKVVEIEKLAHNVKEKMSTSLTGPPVFRPPIYMGR